VHTGLSLRRFNLSFTWTGFHVLRFLSVRRVADRISSRAVRLAAPFDWLRRAFAVAQLRSDGVQLRGLRSMAANSLHVVLFFCILYSPVFSIQSHSLSAPLPVPTKQLISFVLVQAGRSFCVSVSLLPAVYHPSLGVALHAVLCYSISRVTADLIEASHLSPHQLATECALAIPILNPPFQHLTSP